MARPRNTNRADPLANVADREAAQQAAFEKLYNLECKIADLMAEHIKPLRDEMNTIRGRLSDQLQTPRKYLNAAYKVFSLAEDAKAFEDEDEGTEVQAQIRALFSGLQKSGMVDLVDVAEQTGKKGKAAGRKASAKAANDGSAAAKATPPAEAEPEDAGDDDRDPETHSDFITARAAGENARRAGDSIQENPYEPNSGEARAFEIAYWKTSGAIAHDEGKSQNDNRNSEGTDGWLFWRKGWQQRADSAFNDGNLSGAAGQDEIAPEEHDDELDGSTVQAAE